MAVITGQLVLYEVSMRGSQTQMEGDVTELFLMRRCALSWKG